MAEFSKIVPSIQTSNTTVSEVNGISLTKAKKALESSLPTTSFAQVLESQLSQEQLPTEDIQKDSKQVLPGQNVDASLFGSLIIVVRDVEVSLPDGQENTQPNEQSKLFVPSIFTASTNSSVSVPNVKIKSVEGSIIDEVNKSESKIEQLSRSDSSINQVVNTSSFLQNQKEAIGIGSNLLVSKQVNSKEENEFTKTNTNQFVAGSNSETTKTSNTSTVEKTETISTPKNVTEPLISIVESSKISTNTINPKKIENIPTVLPQTPIQSVTETSNENNGIKPFGTVVPEKKNSPSLSSMLQSVQGLRMGIERSPSQQTFITVTLPISEVDRLVTSNPGMFATKEEEPFVSENLSTPKASSVVENKEVVNTLLSNVTSKSLPNILASSEVNLEPQKKTSDVIEPTKPVQNKLEQKIEKDNTQSNIVSDYSSKVIQTEKSAFRFKKDTVVSNKTPDKNFEDFTSDTFQQISYNSVSKNSESVFVTEELSKNKGNVLANPTSDLKSATTPNEYESLAKTIEIFTTTVQSVNSPDSKNATVQQRENNIRQIVQSQPNPVQITVETVVEKKTLVVQPALPQELEAQKDDSLRSENIRTTVSQLIQKADQDGTPIESLLVKIPIQTSKVTQKPETASKETVGTKENVTPTLAPKIGAEIQRTITTNVPKTEVLILNNQNQTIPIQAPKVEVASNLISSENKTTTNFQEIPKTQPNVLNKSEIPTSKSNSDSQINKEISSVLQRVESIKQKSSQIVENSTKTETNPVSELKGSITPIPKENVEIVESKIMDSITKESVSVPKVSLNDTKPIVEKESVVSGNEEVVFENISIANQTVSAKNLIQPITTVVKTDIPQQVTIEELPQAIIKEFTAEKTSAGSKATFSLNPEQLGSVTVQIDLKGNNATIAIETSTKESVPLLEKQIDVLKEQLKATNILVEKIDILFKPSEMFLTTAPSGDTFVSSQNSDNQSLQQELEKQQQHQKQQHQSTNTENDIVEEVQSRQFGEGSSIIEEYV